ncbi:MAG: GNAT family N-acetyltransferase [Parvibaculum sp.]
MSDLLIREARADDRMALIALMSVLHDSEAAHEANRSSGALSGESHLDWVLHEIDMLGGATLVAEVAGVVEGFLCYAVEEDPGTFVKPEMRRHGMIWDICVSAAMRGRGLGSRLLHAAEADLLARGVREMRLYVLAANSRARALYEEAGYVDYERLMAKRF